MVVMTVMAVEGAGEAPLHAGLVRLEAQHDALELLVAALAEVVARSQLLLPQLQPLPLDHPAPTQASGRRGAHQQVGEGAHDERQRARSAASSSRPGRRRPPAPLARAPAPAAAAAAPEAAWGMAALAAPRAEAPTPRPGAAANAAAAAAELTLQHHPPPSSARPAPAPAPARRPPPPASPPAQPNKDWETRRGEGGEGLAKGEGGASRRATERPGRTERESAGEREETEKISRQTNACNYRGRERKQRQRRV